LHHLIKLDPVRRKEKIALFWKWFAQNHHAFSFLKEVSEEEANLITETFRERLMLLDSRLDYRIDTSEDGRQHTLILNDYEEKSLSGAVKQILSLAPDLPGWTYLHESIDIGLIQPLKGEVTVFFSIRALIDVHIQVIATPSVEKPGGVLIIIYFEKDQPKPDLQEAEEIFKNYIGEYGLQHYVRGIELATPGQTKPKGTVPFTDTISWINLIFPVKPPP
jgi:hypothetical protein